MARLAGQPDRLLTPYKRWVARKKLRRAIADYEQRADVISAEELAAIEAEIGGL